MILGANGSGNTSLLSSVTGCVTPTAGEISVLGRRYGRADWRELRRQIGTWELAGAAGLEPVTSAVTGQRSNQLSYAPARSR